jgi:hypothetical protein
MCVTCKQRRLDQLCHLHLLHHKTISDGYDEYRPELHVRWVFIFHEEKDKAVPMPKLWGPHTVNFGERTWRCVVSFSLQPPKLSGETHGRLRPLEVEVFRFVFKRCAT